MPRFQDLTGNKYYRLTVVKRIIKENSKRTYFLCKCDCGKEIICQSSDLKMGKIRSCGCLRKENAIEIGKKNIKHNQVDTRLYHIWRDMKARCLNLKNKDYKNYGGRGIIVCDEWKNSFQVFYDWATNNGYQENLTIDRIDNNGNYCHENCRWTDIYTQSNNKRDNHKITFNGKTHGISEWSRITGISRDNIKNRLLNLGWTVEKTLTTKPIERIKNVRHKMEM